MSVRRLLVAAAIFHVSIAILLFAAGRMQLAPRYINGDGIVFAAPDSIYYQQEASRPGVWRERLTPLHVRLLSLLFATFGTGILAAEPLNLLCYLAIVALTFAIGREVHGARAGFIAAVVVALWPTFLLHTVQLLKDPLFIAATLAVVFAVVTWLTADYDRRRAIAAGVVMIGALVLLQVIRPKFTVVLVALIAFGLVLLTARQLAEKRLLAGNVACALIALAIAALMLPHTARTFAKVKAHPSTMRGESKAAADPKTRVPALVVWRGVDRDDAMLGTVRERFNMADLDSGSAIDARVELRSANELIAYLPRAAAIGLWAPFPDMWLQSGLMVGRGGRSLAGVETAAMYVVELLAVVAVILPPRRLPTLLLLGISIAGVTMLGLVVTNVGTLYRFRYSFWILLIVAGVAGAEKLVHRRAAIPAIACAALMLVSCTRVRGDLEISNRTGATIEALYLSPTDTPTWEENVLGRDVLRDGETVAIRFDSVAKPALWDLRADGAGHHAEWTRLDLRRIRAVTIRGEKGAAVAEVRAR